MKAIVVDDEMIMLKSFLRLSSGIKDLEITGHFQSAEEALVFAKDNPIEAAFLDVKMPRMNGIELAKRLADIRPGIVIVFISAYDEYVRDSNAIGGDYYIVKPYKAETLEMVMERIRLLIKRQRKDVYVRTFGRFTVLVNDKPVPLRGKAKEIFALIVTRRGKEISNEEIYRTLWEDRPYSNENMTVYYNALRRLKKKLEEYRIENILISTSHGQMADPSRFDCDYYDWLDKRPERDELFEGEFMAEYSWGEYIIGNLVNMMYEQ